MKQTQPAASPCRSVFRGGGAATTAEKYTRLWIALINQLERSKRVLAGTK